MSIANVLQAINFKFIEHTKEGLGYPQLLFRGRSMYGWKVTVARPRIDGVGPNFGVVGRRALQVRSCKTKVQVCLLLQF